jgi:phosphatidylserine/phosphatidylglycerophosphate/cardiolipin synthase-like enzyme
LDEQQIKAIVSERGSVRLSELLACTNPDKKALVELRVLHMIKRGVLKASWAGRDMLLTATPDGEGRAEANPFTNAEVALVVTLPISVQRGRGLLQRYIDTLDALNMSISSANRELRISSPFADPDTVALLYPSFRKAAGRGVRVKFLVRSARDRQLLTALRNVRDVYMRLGIPDMFSVRCYEVNVAGLLVEAIHAKVVIADRELAYVGSGELRRHSLIADVEVGLLVRGVAVERLVDLFDVVWDRASDLSLVPP